MRLRITATYSATVFVLAFLLSAAVALLVVPTRVANADEAKASDP